MHDNNSPPVHKEHVCTDCVFDEPLSTRPFTVREIKHVGFKHARIKPCTAKDAGLTSVFCVNVNKENCL